MSVSEQELEIKRKIWLVITFILVSNFMLCKLILNSIERQPDQIGSYWFAGISICRNVWQRELNRNDVDRLVLKCNYDEVYNLHGIQMAMYSVHVLLLGPKIDYSSHAKVQLFIKGFIRWRFNLVDVTEIKRYREKERQHEKKSIKCNKAWLSRFWWSIWRSVLVICLTIARFQHKAWQKIAQLK